MNDEVVCESGKVEKIQLEKIIPPFFYMGCRAISCRSEPVQTTRGDVKRVSKKINFSVKASNVSYA